MSAHADAASEAVGPLLESIQAGRTDILKTILEEVHRSMAKGAADKEDADFAFRAFLNLPLAGGGENLIREAVRRDNGDAVRTLLLLGADPSAPIAAAIAEGAPDISLWKASSAAMRDVLTSSAIAAVAGSQAEAVRRLLAAGVDPGAPDTASGSGRTLLHWAAACADAATVSVILAYPGVDPSATDSSGATPLHEALLRKDEAVAAALVRAGARIDIAAIEG